jgi:hypothetical protein
MHITLKLIWRTKKDANVCPVCNALEGYTWSLEAGDSLPKKLVHPIHGPVYDTRPAAVCSLVKEEKGHVCRCTLERQLDVSASKEESEVVDESKEQPENKIVHQE